MLHIYNTLTRQKELFQPLNPPKVGMYVCGMTVYDFCHIGNARVFVFFDVVARYLRHLGYQLTYVRNITDIDDKIIKRAQETNQEYNFFTQKYIDAMHLDMGALGVQNPSVEPKVSEHLEAIITLIQLLLDKGYAYKTANGDIYYDINKFKSYGELAQQELSAMRAGARVEVNEIKRDPLDFVLWKNAKPNEPAWDVPWGGKGRPGWHIECSAMAQQYLGKHFDLHGGGADLQFPHHQNEIAQSEAAYDCKLANYWMHVGFVSVNREKMSKSLGNFFTIREVLKQYHPEVLRYFLLASHYRSPLNYSQENLDMAQAALTRLYTAIRGLDMADSSDDTTTPPLSTAIAEITAFTDAMNDDFNIPLALSHMFELSHHINKLKDAGEIKNATTHAHALRHKMGYLLGILQQNAEDFLQGKDRVNNNNETQIIELINARNLARKSKNWAEADRIRDVLLEMGVTIEDTPHGTTWKKA